MSELRTVPQDDEERTGETGIIFVNGEYLDASEAKVSVLDHGFLYGDNVFDAMHARGRRVFMLDEHLQRLSDSARYLRIEPRCSTGEIREATLETLRRNDLTDAYVRVVLSRGAGYPTLDARVTRESTVVIFVTDPTPPSFLSLYGERPEGLRVAVVSLRKVPPICFESRVKAGNYINNILARMEAVAAGADEALLLDVHNFVAEGPGENVFVVKDGRLLTPGTQNILAGITRAVVMDLAAELGVETVERNLTLYDVYLADEAFFTSTYGGVLPIGEVDGRPIGRDRPGELTARLQAGYEARIESSGVRY